MNGNKYVQKTQDRFSRLTCEEADGTKLLIELMGISDATFQQTPSVKDLLQEFMMIRGLMI